jgi:DinB superfamily
MKQNLLIPALLLVVASAIAQTQTTSAQATTPPTTTAPTATPPTTTAPTTNPVSTALRDVLPNRQKNTIAAVEAMPADKFSYRPTPAQNTFGHLVAHMVEANNTLCSGAAAVPAPKVEQVSEWDSKDKLVAALKASFDFCSDALAKMDDSKLGETADGPGGQPLSRARFALGVASNWADHYAEAAMYLRLNGLLPPTAKK